MPNPIDDKLKEHIKKQLTFNSGKNLFANEENNSLLFTDITETLVECVRNMDSTTQQWLVDYLTDEVLQEFCRINQFFSFNAEAVLELKSIYAQLNSRISAVNPPSGQTELYLLSREHYQNLRNWLIKTNAFAGKIYPEDREFVEPVVCSEYTPELQLDIIHMELKGVQEPVLDIGCGRGMRLVNYLRGKGIEAVGLDRFEVGDAGYIQGDWLEYNYEPCSWGSIISHLGFSNHFIHHHLRGDGNYREYAVKYMEILNSLKIGGSFYYAPDLPFIEKYLDGSKYHYSGHPIPDYEYKASRITRIC